ncbi:TM2 domain-containing protein [Blattella germanica]|nr:TM2 domain-containing protein [Blattella germanica]
MKTVVFLIVLLVTLLQCCPSDSDYRVECSTLRMGQFICPDPDPEYDYIDPKTQQPYGCTRENKAKVRCKAADGINCTETNNSTFKRDIPCKWTNGYSFETAMLLSIFLGMFGADRFYLGYPAIGLLKFCTLGFMFLGQLVDIILIATQVVGPADGSHYVIPFYGAGIEVVRSDNWTYKLPQNDW